MQYMSNKKITRKSRDISMHLEPTGREIGAIEYYHYRGDANEIFSSAMELDRNVLAARNWGLNAYM